MKKINVYFKNVNKLITTLAPLDSNKKEIPKARIRSIKIICNKTNKENSFSTLRDAAKALKIDVKSLQEHIELYSDNGSNTLFKNKFVIIVVRSKSRGLNVHSLALNKSFVYHEDKKTLAFVFDSIVDACRALTPIRCKNLSSTDLTENKNIQHTNNFL